MKKIINAFAGKRELRKIKKAIPKTFFESRELGFRVERLVDMYNRAMKCYYEIEMENLELSFQNENLKAENDRLRRENATALAMLS